MGIKEEFEKEFGFLRTQKDAIRFSDIEKAANWMAETIELIILSELGHTKNNSQRAYTWHEIEDLLMEIMKLAKELSDGK